MRKSEGSSLNSTLSKSAVVFDRVVRKLHIMLGVLCAAFIIVASSLYAATRINHLYHTTFPLDRVYLYGGYIKDGKLHHGWFITYWNNPGGSITGPWNKFWWNYEADTLAWIMGLLIFVICLTVWWRIVRRVHKGLKASPQPVRVAEGA